MTLLALGTPELILGMVILVLLFERRLPEIGRALGRRLAVYLDTADEIPYFLGASLIALWLFLGWLFFFGLPQWGR